MKKKIWGVLLSVAVLVTTVNFPTTAGAEENKGGADAPGIVVKVSDDMNGSNANETDEIQTVQISAQNQSNMDAVVRIFLLNEDKETADTEVEIPNLCDKDQITDETVQTEMAETLKSALTLESGTNSALDAQWIEKKDDSGNVTAKYLEAALPAGTAAAFDMQLMYRTDEENYTKKTIVRAKAFVDEQDVTEASDREEEDNETEVMWEMVQSDDASEAAEESEDAAKESEEVTDTAAASAESTKKSAASARSVETYAESRSISAPPDQSITSMYNVPVTYYDYLDDNELINGWKNVKTYGFAYENGWSPFWHWNRAIAQYYTQNNVNLTGLYFGNLYTGTTSDTNGNNRKAEVQKQIAQLIADHSEFSYAANNSNNLSGGMHSSAYGLVYNTLDDQGNLQIADNVIAPWFNESLLASKNDYIQNSYGQVFSSRFPFRTVDENGVSYYEFDSNNGTDNVRYENGSFHYATGSNNGVDDGADDCWGSSDSDNGDRGFFPFNKPGDGGTNRNLDYGFGAKFEIRFNLPKGGEITNSSGNKVPVTFEFTGDDDVWVFIDGKLVLDMGGDHKKANGVINFKELTANVTTGGQTINGSAEYNAVSLQEALGVSSSAELSPNEGHTMTIFYMERGMIESNLKIRFNMQPLEQEFIAEKDVNVESVNEGLQDTVENADEFDVDLTVDGSAAADKTYQKNDGNTGNTEYGLTTGKDGSFSLRDGDQAVFKKQFDENIGDKFTAQESTVQDGKSYLSYDTTWSAVDLENNDEVIGSGTTTKAEFTYNKTAGDEFTPVRNKLTYVNTPQTGQLTVQKKTVDKNNSDYSDAETEFTFQIMLDMGIGTEGHYETPIVTDKDTIYFRVPDDSWTTVYAYCYNLNNDGSNDGSNGNWPGVKMEAVSTDAGVYKLDSIIGKYDYVTFSNGSNQYPARGTDYAINDKNYFYVNNNSLNSGTYEEKGEPEWVPGEKLGYDAYDLTYTVNGEARVAENGSFTLKSGETAVFAGIPVGTRFKIRETSADGYSLKDVTIDGQPTSPDADKYYSGEIKSKGTDAAVIVTNQKEETAVNITAWKTIDEGSTNVPADKFTFILEGQTPKEIDGKWSVDTSKVCLEEKNVKGGKISFDTLTYTEEGIYFYTIKERIPEDDAGYVYDKTEYEVKVVVTAEGDQMQAVTTVKKVKDKDGNTLNPAEEVSDIKTGIKFDNTTNLATLTVQKWLVKEDGSRLDKNSWPNQNVTFSFRLEMKNDAGEWTPCMNQPYILIDGTSSQKGATGSEGRFTIRAQEIDSAAKIEFQNLVIGTEYRVIEDLKDRTRYEFHSLIVDGETQEYLPTGDREYATDSIKIKKDGNQIIFKNYPLNRITIEKQDENGNPLEGAEFTLEKWNADSQEWQAYGEKVTSGSDGKAYFQNLHAGKYRITEIKTKAGYVLLKEPIEITLPYEYKAGSIVNGTKVTSDGTAYNITFTIVNGQAFDLPASGLSGIGPIAAAGIAIVVIAGAVFAARNIKGQRAASNRRKHRPH